MLGDAKWIDDPVIGQVLSLDGYSYHIGFEGTPEMVYHLPDLVKQDFDRGFSGLLGDGVYEYWFAPDKPRTPEALKLLLLYLDCLEVDILVFMVDRWCDIVLEVDHNLKIVGLRPQGGG